MDVKVFLLPGGRMPTRAHETDAGWDLYAREPAWLPPAGGRALVPTGIRMEIPVGYEVQLRPRSGLALKHGISIVNAPATIDSGYIGELGVVLLNTDPLYPFRVEPGDRIAQLVVAKLSDAVLVPAEGEPAPSSRGDGGFGSTGR